MSAPSEAAAEGSMRTESPVVALVIPVYNASVHLPALFCWIRQEEHRFRFSVVFCDNGSTDGSWDLVKQFAGSVDFASAVQSVACQSAAHARNAGVAASRGDILIFCDADDVPADGWVEAMVTALASDGFVNGALDYERFNTPDQRAARSPLLRDGPTMLFGCPFASGANFGCRRWVWDRLGGQDESLPPGAEDADFSIRACRELGVPARYVAEAVVHYRLRSGRGASYRQARAYGINDVAIYVRHGDVSLRSRCNAAVYRLSTLLVTLVRSSFSAVARNQLAWQWGKASGRVAGSIRYRTFYL